jgi:hypothetical protein
LRLCEPFRLCATSNLNVRVSRKDAKNRKDR